MESGRSLIVRSCKSHPYIWFLFLRKLIYIGINFLKLNRCSLDTITLVYDKDKMFCLS